MQPYKKQGGNSISHIPEIHVYWLILDRWLNCKRCQLRRDANSPLSSRVLVSARIEDGIMFPLLCFLLYRGNVKYSMICILHVIQDGTGWRVRKIHPLGFQIRTCLYCRDFFCSWDFFCDTHLERITAGASDISTYTTRSHVGDSSDKITLTTRISHHAQDQFNTYAVSEPGHAQRAKAEPSSSFVPLWAVGLAAFLVAGAVCSAIMKPVASRCAAHGTCVCTSLSCSL